MKLELKHLAPYLPYRLKIQYKFDGFEICISPMVASMTSNSFAKEIPINTVLSDNKSFKPILRPLSDLNDEENNTPEYLQGCCYSYVTYLISQHYDVFGLIEKGLAIDINTLDEA